MDRNAYELEVLRAQAPHLGFPGDVANPAANIAATVTYPALASQRHCITGIYFGFDDVPAAALLQITSGARVLFSVYVTAAGMGFLPISKKGLNGEAMTITLAAGGAGVSGSLSIGNHWAE